VADKTEKDAVAQDEEIRELLEEFVAVSMDQTGGMCSAVGVSLYGGQHSLFIVADEESEEPLYLAGVLDGDSCQ
jgi:hypothetical protein